MWCQFCVKCRNVGVGLTDGTGGKEGGFRLVADYFENVTFHEIREEKMWSSVTFPNACCNILSCQLELFIT